MANRLVKGIFALIVIALCALLTTARPVEEIELPPPGFAFGGIPYGSMSGNVAEYYRMKEAELQHQQYAHYAAQPVVQYPNYYPSYYNYH